MIFLLSLLTATAQTNSVRSLSLKECLRIALEHNLDIKIERITPQIAQYRLKVAYSAYEPTFDAAGTRGFDESPGGVDEQNRPFPGTKTDTDEVAASINGVLPTGLSYDLNGYAQDKSGRGADGPFEGSDGFVAIELRQPLLRNFWTDEVRLEIQMNKKLLKISEEEFRLRVMNVVTSVEFAYFDLKLAWENLRVQQSALVRAEQLLAGQKERVAQGTLAPLDEKQAESQVASQHADVLSAERILSAQQNELKSLLSDDFKVWQDVVIEPADELAAPRQSFNRTTSWEIGMAQRPELQQARLELQRLGFVLKYRRNQMFPQLDVVGSYGYNGAGSEFSRTLSGIERRDSPFYSYGAVLSVPLGNGSARNNYKIAKSENERSLLRLQQLEQSVLIEIEDAVKLAQTNFERVDSTQKARLFAQQALDAEQTKFENGRSTSFFVLQFQRDLTTARLREAQSLADYNKALAQLALREGTVLERSNLKVEVK
ncbi:MAG TPA: TolC family protein [Methylomirabilota bacterium]|nr:TolC family protein [Methylomirabilota bacterium]